jgi:hypothetical protein
VRRGISQAELIGIGLAADVPDDDQSAGDGDPWRDLAGFGSPDVGAKPGEIDDVVEACGDQLVGGVVAARGTAA